MQNIQQTVFLCYRRANVAWALAIFQDLTQHGFDVFFDFTGIGSGDFERVIIENIKARAHFLVLLTPSALERCIEPEDLLRREIETAIATLRNIVPLMLEGFDFSTPEIDDQLRGTLEPLRRYNALSVPATYFTEAMQRLRDRYLNVPLDAVLHPASPFAQQSVKEQQAAAGNAPSVQQQELSAEESFGQGVKAAIVGDNTQAVTWFRKAAEASRPNIEFALEAQPIPIRCEGYTELISSLLVSFTYNGDIEISPFLVVILYLNTTVTSSLAGAFKGPDFAPHQNRHECEAIMFEVGRFTDTVPVNGRLSGSAIMFEGIVLTGLRPGDRRVFQIANVRCNANHIAPGSSIQASVAVAGAVAENPMVCVGRVESGLAFPINDASGHAPLPSTGFPIGSSAGLPITRIATLRFEERCSGAFKARASKSPIFSESCSFGILREREDHQLAFSGAADTGTRLRARFSCAETGTGRLIQAPIGLRLFVSLRAALAGSHLMLEIVAEQSSLIPGAPLAVNALWMQEVAFVDGSAKAVWEVVQPNIWSEDPRYSPLGPGYADIAVWAAYTPPVDATSAYSWRVMMNACFDPTFPPALGGVSSGTLPVPRFFDTSTAVSIIQMGGSLHDDSSTG